MSAKSIIAKSMTPRVCAAALILLLSGCVVREGPPGPYYAQPGYVQPGPAYYEGYYDDYYGPVTDGYWAGDGFFYYRGRDHRYYRGDSRHFRRDAAQGYHHFQARRGDPRDGGRDHGDHRNQDRH